MSEIGPISVHVKYCKDLELVHPKDFITINESYDFFVEKFIPPTNPNERIYTICDLCISPFEGKASELYETKKKCWDVFCPDCVTERKKSLKWSVCSMCSNKFTCYSYYYKMKKMSLPLNCSKCRVKNRSDLREQHEFISNQESIEKEEGIL